MNLKQTTLKIVSEMVNGSGIDLAEVVSRLKCEYKPDKQIDWYGEVLKTRATTILNTAEYYSTGNGIFQRFEDMNRDDQVKKLNQWKNEGDKLQQKINRHRKQIKGQVIMVFNEDGTCDYKEVV